MDTHNSLFIYIPIKDINLFLIKSKNKNYSIIQLAKNRISWKTVTNSTLKLRYFSVTYSYIFSII